MRVIRLRKGSVNVVAIKISNQCVKMELPNTKTVDILADVFAEINKWLQIDSSSPESGGYILGYKHVKTGNISLEFITTPLLLDFKTRNNFKIKDPKHQLQIFNAKTKKSFYMGVWHTHPQKIPTPSSIDWNDWYETLESDQSACEYILFLIAGTDGIRVWAGDPLTKQINEIYECEKEGDLYKKI